MKKASKIITLNTLKCGQRATVFAVCTKDRILEDRLLAMGLVIGTPIEVLRIAPLGDPIKIKALGYKLSLRLSEAEKIQVQLLK